MATYLYRCPIHGEFEETHSINIRLEECPKCQQENLPPQKLTRLIARCSFVLVGGGWANQGYS